MLTILYATQTGTAKYVSNDLAREAMRRGLATKVDSLESYTAESLLDIDTPIIFIIATTGQGDPTDNMKSFWLSLLDKDLPNTLLIDTHFTVFGLGDSSYQEYNAMARKLWVRLQQLGAKPFYRRGLGDELHDFEYEAEYHPWLDGFWASLAAFDVPMKDRQEGLLPSMYKLSISISTPNPIIRGKPTAILYNSRITQDPTNTHHVIIEGKYDFQPGDICQLYPQNSPEAVSAFLSLLGYEEDPVIDVSINPEHKFGNIYSAPDVLPFPVPNKLSFLLTHYFDFRAQPSRYFIEVLSYFVDQAHIEKLQEMASKTLEGRNEYHRYITKEKRTFYEVLWDFDAGKRVPLEYLLELLPIIRAREYSISNTPTSTNIELIVSMLSYKTPLGRLISGFCTSYIQKCEVSSEVHIDIKKGILPIPPISSPLLMIACGSGLAPFRSLLQHRIQEGGWDNTLIFGCRHPDKDELFKSELESYEEQGQLILIPAFSRIGEGSCYVQHKIAEHEVLVHSLIQQGGYILVCGTSKGMPLAVKEAVSYAWAKLEGIDISQGREFISNLQRLGLFYIESW